MVSKDAAYISDVIRDPWDDRSRDRDVDKLGARIWMNAATSTKTSSVVQDAGHDHQRSWRCIYSIYIAAHREAAAGCAHTKLFCSRKLKPQGHVPPLASSPCRKNLIFRYCKSIYRLGLFRPSFHILKKKLLSCRRRIAKEFMQNKKIGNWRGVSKLYLNLDIM